MKYFCIFYQQNILKTIDLEGPIPELIEQIEGLLSPYIVGNYKLDGTKLKASQEEISHKAIREALINALIHRKYSIRAGIKVALFQNRLEIFSPGNFPGPLTENDYESGITYPRNERLRRLARKAGLVEKRGLGLKLILSESKPTLFSTGSDSDYTEFGTSLLGAPNKFLYSKYGRQPYNISGGVTISKS